MNPSDVGLALIQRWEGCSLEAYLDAVGVATIGYGCIAYPDGRPVRMGDRITREQADALLAGEVEEKAAAISRLIEVAVSQNQFDALTSLAYNIGEGAFAGSTLLRRLNAGDEAGAAEQFLAWNKGTIDGVKVEIEGLTNRRRDEKRLFESKAAPGEPILPSITPQEEATWLEAYNDQGKTVIVAWKEAEVMEILELESASKTMLADTIMQYPQASTLLIAAPGKSVPPGERIPVQSRTQRTSSGSASAESESAPPAPRGVLSRGSSGTEVGVMQERLQESGFYRGPINKEFDSTTDEAVRRFQAEVFGLAEADGRVGPRTWAALWSRGEGGEESAPPGVPGQTYLRLVNTNQRDPYGLNVLRLDYIKTGAVAGSLKVCSGAPGCQVFRTGTESQRGSNEPLPEGLWFIHNIEWCDGRDNYNGAVFSSGLGPVSIPLDYKGPGTTRRGNIEIHIDWNREGVPGTAGCIGIYSIGDYKTLVSWLRETDPRDLYVDWGLGTCPQPAQVTNSQVR
ncbi:MAG: glycoside hydrolase family protein [Cyanobacteriota bacterium]|nr:glycoside hydrolase family protein [Cyanobacteriota bacterium]